MQHPHSDISDSCDNIIYQSVDVDLLISLTPVVKIDKVTINCNSDPTLVFRHDTCSLYGLEVMVTQTFTFEISIEYSVDSSVNVII